MQIFSQFQRFFFYKNRQDFQLIQFSQFPVKRDNFQEGQLLKLQKWRFEYCYFFCEAM